MASIYDLESNAVIACQHALDAVAEAISECQDVIDDRKGFPEDRQVAQEIVDNLGPVFLALQKVTDL